jgi:hypothetical protein
MVANEVLLAGVGQAGNSSVRVISTERDRRGFQPALDEPVVVGDEPLPGDVVLVEAEPLGSRWRSGTSTSIRKHVPGPKWAAALAKQATCLSWLARFMIVLNTR